MTLTGSITNKETREAVKVLEAIQEGEPEVAAQAMQAHLEWALAHSKQEMRRRLGFEAVE